MFNIEKILQTFGILGVGAIVFAESGLLIGFFLPGDTLLFISGFFAAQGHLNIYWLITVIVAAAIIGDNVGYSIGRRTGPRIFRKEDGIFFQKKHIERAEKFYNDHGGKTIILARFVPVVRTFAPMVAGIGKMPRQRFMLYNVMGALIWGVGVTLLGYFAGAIIDPHIIELFVIPVFLLVTLLTFGPALHHLLKEKSTRQKIAERFKLGLRNIFLNKKID